jgi:hypothetical protein
MKLNKKSLHYKFYNLILGDLFREPKTLFRYLSYHLFAITLCLGLPATLIELFLLFKTLGSDKSQSLASAIEKNFFNDYILGFFAVAPAQSAKIVSGTAQVDPLTVILSLFAFIGVSALCIFALFAFIKFIDKEPRRK